MKLVKERECFSVNHQEDSAEEELEGERPREPASINLSYIDTPHDGYFHRA